MGKKVVLKSAKNGQFVSAAKVKASPATTYKQTVQTGSKKGK